MKQQKYKPKHFPELSGSLQPDDGIDPRYDVRGSRSSGKVDRKAAQLCAQVRHALDFIVPAVLQDTELDAMVLDVQPAPNTGNLLVLLTAVDPAQDDMKLHNAIIERAGTIRLSVAQSIQRRKTPTLTYRVVRS
jgi:ribosome-binding factor A